MFLIDPLYSYWVIFSIFLVLIFLTWQARKSTGELFCRWGALIILLLVGLQFSFHTVEKTPPENPIQIIYESFAGENYDEEIEAVARDLSKHPGAQNVKTTPLDERWDNRPVFEDYNLLKEKTGEYPVEIIVGQAIHTAASPGFFSSRDIADSPAHRLLLNPVPSKKEARLKLDEQVIVVDSPGKVTWEVEIRGGEQLENPRLVLRRGDEILRKAPPSAREGVLKLDSPGLEEGIHYFTVELLEENEQELEVGHKRRASVGAIVEDFTRKLLIVDNTPGWRSGWWGRKINKLENWEVDYHYRQPGGDLPERPDVILYFGFPATGSQFNDFERLWEEDSGFLFVVDEAGEAYSLFRMLGIFGLDGDKIVRRQGEFEIYKAKEVADNFPPLLAYERQLKIAPPVNYFYLLPDGGDFTPLLKTEDELVLGLLEDQSRGILTYPDFHRLAMRWGKLGYERAGGKLAREIIQKLDREREEKEGRILARRWVLAGEKVEISRDISYLQLESPVKREWGQDLPEELSFPRPGKYRFSYRRGEEKFTEELLVVESNRMRYPRAENRIRDFVRPANIFDSPVETAARGREIWESRHRTQKNEIFNWGNPLLLTMAGLFLAFGWLLADRHEV